MKIIDALKEVKAIREKIVKLTRKISENSAYREDFPTEYKDPAEEIKSWQTQIHAATARMEELLLRISFTNLQTKITIKIGDNTIEKPIAGWMYRQRELANLDRDAWSTCTNRRLRLEVVHSKNTNEKDKVYHVILNYDAKTRDKKVEEYETEPGVINARLETVNATTDLLEL